MAGELTAILAVLTFVVSNVIFRKTEHEASPAYINFFRTGIGTLTFFIIAIILNVFVMIFLIPLEIWIFLIISFVFGQVVGDTAYFNAQKELGTTIAIAVSMTFPLFTFILAVLFLNQPFDGRVILSIILIGCGITIISRSKIKSDNNDMANKSSETNTLFSVKAIGFGLIASLGWAVGLVIIDFATNKIDQILQSEQSISSLIGNMIRFPFALFMLASMVLRENYSRKKNEIQNSHKRSLKTYILLLVGALIGTSLGAYIYTEAARTAGATFMSLIASASPLFALPITYFINNERISKLGFAGVVLTITGVISILI